MPILSGEPGLDQGFVGRHAEPERIATCLLAGSDPGDPHDVDQLLAVGRAIWVGDPDEGVIVLPATELLGRYEKLPPPMRASLVG